MKIGILTHYNVNNQGAQLQMYAMYNQLRKLGHYPVILKYNKNFDFNQREQLKNDVSYKSIPYFVKNYLINKGIGLTWFNTKKYLKNKKFREKYFDFNEYTTDRIDCAIVGSDEVYSLQTGVNIMMYGHGLSTDKVFSYAPSFGQTSMELIEKHNCKELISSGLKKCIALAARDEHTYKMIEKLTCIEPTMVCDPVILYDFSETHTMVKKIDRKYLLVYSYDRWMIEENEVDSIKRFAKSKGLITVSVGTYHKWCDKNINCNCIEWVEYFRNSELVITDTFHGAILSIITNRPMAVYVRNLNVNKLTDLLVKTKLEHRRVNQLNYDELNKVFDTNINFEEVNNALKNLRDKSSAYLVKALDTCKEGE